MHTSERQAYINNRNAKKKLISLILSNFNSKDYFITFICGEEYKEEKQAVKEIQNTFRRIKRMYANSGKTLKYIWIMKHNNEIGLYFRILISKGIEHLSLQRAFPNGKISLRALNIDVQSLVLCELRDAPITYRRWSCSKNLKPLLPTE